MSAQVYVKWIESRPYRDLYSDVDLPTETYLLFYPTIGHIIVEQDFVTKNGISYDRFVNLELAVHIPDHPLDEDIMLWIESRMADFQFVADNYELFYENGNKRGRFTSEQSRMTWERICESVNQYGFGPGWQFWNVIDWCDAEIHNVNVDTTDAELSTFATLWTPMKSEHVVLYGNILQYITQVRDDLIEELYA